MSSGLWSSNLFSRALFWPRVTIFICTFHSCMKVLSWSGLAVKPRFPIILHGLQIIVSPYISKCNPVEKACSSTHVIRGTPKSLAFYCKRAPTISAWTIWPDLKFIPATIALTPWPFFTCSSCFRNFAVCLTPIALMGKYRATCFFYLNKFIKINNCKKNLDYVHKFAYLIIDSTFVVLTIS